MAISAAAPICEAGGAGPRMDAHRLGKARRPDRARPKGRSHPAVQNRHRPLVDRSFRGRSASPRGPKADFWVTRRPSHFQSERRKALGDRRSNPQDALVRLAHALGSTTAIHTGASTSTHRPCSPLATIRSTSPRSSGTRTYRWFAGHADSSSWGTARSRRRSCLWWEDHGLCEIGAIRTTLHDTTGRKKPPHLECSRVWRCLEWWSWREP